MGVRLDEEVWRETVVKMKEVGDIKEGGRPLCLFNFLLYCPKKHSASAPSTGDGSGGTI